MSNLYKLADYRRKKALICFTRQELNLLLSHYSRRVISGTWKAYAIDHSRGMAQFSIYVHARAEPMYRVQKLRDNAKRMGGYVVMKGNRRIAEAETLGAALGVFQRELKLVSP